MAPQIPIRNPLWDHNFNSLHAWDKQLVIAKLLPSRILSYNSLKGSQAWTSIYTYPHSTTALETSHQPHSKTRIMPGSLAIINLAWMEPHSCSLDIALHQLLPLASREASQPKSQHSRRILRNMVALLLVDSLGVINYQHFFCQHTGFRVTSECLTSLFNNLNILVV